ncbi:MAG: (2Fe-2S)-binding protein [Elusimicrobia bacterium]|nr:(2Fe-2S)-binding protein [Elusimicrobiota bacterium]
MKGTIRIQVNGVWRELVVGRDVEPHETLSHLLRERFGLTGLKLSCEEGACGACTVAIDGKAALSCMTLAVELDGRSVATIEGLSEDDPVIRAFAEQCEPGYGTALQCGYCTPGFVMASKALLAENPSPSESEIKEGLSGNICRCGCYSGIVRAVQYASRKGAKGGSR